MSDMVGWATKREEDICLTCHRTLLFTYRVRDDGGRIEGMPPTAAVAFEADTSDPALTWVTLQTRCMCGARAGRVVDLRNGHVSPASS